jgi:hypothetical protein
MKIYGIYASLLCLLLAGCEPRESDTVVRPELTEEELEERNARDYEDFCRTHRRQHPEFYRQQ